MNAKKPLFSFKDMTCRRGGRNVFARAGFDVAAGEIWHVQGANGCGKSSLLRQVAGLLPRVRGDLFWESKKIEVLSPDKFSYLHPHDQCLNILETCGATLRFWARMSGSLVDEAGMATILSRAGLAGFSDQPVRVLSSGQRRRLSLARVAASGARLWLLDEPLNALDAQGVGCFETMVAQHLQTGGAVIAASHIPFRMDVRIFDLGRCAA